MSDQYFVITPDTIVVKGKQGTTLATIALRFSVGATPYHVVALAPRGSGYLGTTQDSAVTVDIQPAGNSVSVELQGDFAESDAISYFTGSSVEAVYGRAFVPDADCRRFLTADKEVFYLTNSGMILQRQVKKQDLWMIAPPPHVIAFGDDDHGWCGLSMPEPLPVVFTRISCQQRNFQVVFNHYSPRHAEGRLPRVFIDAGLADGKDMLECHRAHAEDLGLIDTHKKSYAWWHNPIYCTWGDQCYLQKTAPQTLETSIAIPMDAAKLLHWADGVRAIYPGEVNYIVDAGWFDYLGDYQPKLPEFKNTDDFAALIAQLKAKGFRVILWYTPFWAQKGSAIEREHPEYLIRRRDGSIYRDENQHAFLDFSNPEVRGYTKGRVEYMLKTLDADGFKIDMNYVHPLMRDILLHDSGWGYGNQLWLQMMKFFHATATAIKEDAFFTISGIESYLQPYASSVRLNDLFDFTHAQAWYNRAELVTRLMPDVPIDVDGWPSSVEKMREYQFVSPVFGAPVTYYIDAVDIMTEQLTDADLNRMASTWHVYSKAPCEQGMRVTMDADADVFARRGPQGELKALALQRSALVCYAGEKIYLTANLDRAVSIPVDAVERYTKAEKIYRDGTREPVTFFKDGASLLLNVADAGRGILCYEIS